MHKIEEINNPVSCLNRCEDGEPVFVVRASDYLAPQTVRTWAARYAGDHTARGTYDARRREKVAEALELAAEMQAWRKRKSEAELTTPA